MRLLKLLAGVAFTIFSLFLIGTAVLQYLDRPIVYMSTTTERCVRVEVPPGQKPLSCADILRDGTYELVWVK